MKILKNAISKLTDPIYQRQGFIRSTIILEWKLIVGTQFAQFCQPEKITFPLEKRTGGRLILKTTSSFAPELQFQEPIIIDRINKYFGYRAVDKLIIRHGMTATNNLVKRKERPLSDEMRSHLQESVEGISNEDLQQALMNLGVGIMGKSESKTAVDAARMTEQDGVGKVESVVRPPDLYRWDGSKI